MFSGTSGHTTNIWQLKLPISTMHAEGVPSRLTTSTDREIGPALLADGRIAYSNWRLTANVWRLSTASGAFSPVTDGELTDSLPSVSRDGSFAVFMRRAGEERQMTLKDLRTGMERQLMSSEMADPYISADGHNIAYSLHNSVYLREAASSSESIVCRDCGEIVSRTADGQVAILRVNTGRPDSAIAWLDLQTGQLHRIISKPGISEAVMSPDSRLMTFTVRSYGVLSRIYLTRLANGVAVGEPVPITSSDSWADNAVWSKDEDRIYYSSQRDGFQCIWMQDIDPFTNSPRGEPKAVHHMHKAAFSPTLFSRSAFRMTAGGDSLYFIVGSVEANLWIYQP